MIQKDFAKHVVEKIRSNPDVLGLAAGGSWISDELDKYSDLDLVLVTKSLMSDDRIKMISFASALGELLNAFTGEHVGEPRLLVCMYDNPFLHVDIKFVTPAEFRTRVEDPVVLFERDGILSQIIASTKSEWPVLDFQWIEDRFWTWIHYIALKLGRGEYFEVIYSVFFLHTTVISPLMLVKNKHLPRGLRKVESILPGIDLGNLKATLPDYDVNSIINSLGKIVILYKNLRQDLFPESVIINEKLRERVEEYVREVVKNKT